MKLHQRLRRDQARHADDWLITYADTITLLLCLFVVILSIKTNGKSLPRDVSAPVVLASVTGDIFGGHPPFPAVREPSPDPEMEAPRLVADSPRQVAALDVPVPAVVSAPPAHVPDTVEAPGDRITTETPGDRITTLQINSAAFFGSGFAVLSEPGKAILRDVAVTLKSGEYAAYRIAVEGHTDDSPINTVQFQSNWELSTARAAAVVRFFLEQGITAAKLTAAGYADTFPVAPNRAADGTIIPENQAKNRRVVIRLEKIDKAER